MAFGLDNKNIQDIQFEGNNDDVVWRSPITDFYNGSKVTVYEPQEALFYYNGACVGVLGPGMHILETEYIPFLKRIIARVLGARSIFHAQIYYVNRVMLDIKWGAGDIVYQDPAGPVFNIGCYGQMNLQAQESRRIVEKLLGTQPSLKKDDVEARFRQFLVAQVRDCMVNTMLDNQISITMVSGRVSRISELLAPGVADLFGKYGFSLEEFVISGVNIPEDDPEYLRLKRLRANQGLRMSELQLQQQEELMMSQLEAQKTRIQADAAAYKRQTEGYDYATERQFEFLNNIATNQNASAGISSDMLQMGAGLGMIGTVSGMMQNMTSPYVNAMGGMTGMPGQQGYGYGYSAAQAQGAGRQGYGYGAPQVPGAGQQGYGYGAPQVSGATQREAPQSAGYAASQAPAEDPVEVLTRLKRLLDAGLIEQAEYDAKKNEILSRM